jgi:hypothetical protein
MKQIGAVLAAGAILVAVFGLTSWRVGISEATAYGCGFRDGVYGKDPDKACVSYRANAVEHGFPSR